jgi:spermidine/putrescine-binding protein
MKRTSRHRHRPRRPIVLTALAAAALLGGAALVAACGKRDAGAPAPTGAPRAEAGELNIYVWSAYLPTEVLDAFSKKTGITVHFDLYDSNEALLEKLQSGVADYDFVVPSDYMVRILIAEGLVQPIDTSALPMKNLDPRFLDQEFDPGNKYSVPYFWGTTGLGYDKAKLGPVDSWAALFDPAHKGRILMLDDMREAFAVALKSMGRSLNERDPAVLRQAAEKLRRQKALVATYNSADFANILAAGDVDLAHGYNGQLAEAVQAHPDRLAYVVPKEGATLWMDNVCIPKEARHVEAAHRFLAYIMEPAVNAQIVDSAHYASANLPAKKLIRPEISNDPSIYPGDDVLARCELIQDLGDTTTMLDQYWTEIKSH